ncbi:SAG family member [Eimeria mitis]|uniref:SAG family member n=1 Tax=Eimeria mitis TaxID=44415 RepID=U6JP78_9EIME|nr:SAG family member [Eimeria mitis]CDJ27305.1 SAG family member [Eimeria mitis]
MEEVTKTYKFKVVEVDEDVYLAANLARNGKLPVHISEVTKDEDLLADVRKGVVDEQGVLLQGTCSEMKIKSNLKKFIFHTSPAAMASLYKTAAAVCLVALYGLQSEAAEEAAKTYKFKVVEVDEGVYLAANLARNGKLPVHISEVTKDEDLIAGVRKGVVDEQGTILQGPCNEMKIKSGLEAFHHTFDYQDGPNFRELLQAALDAGLAVFKEKGYPKTDDEWQQIWANDTSAVLAHLLGSNSTKIGCVIGKCVEVTTQPPSDDQERREGSGGGEGNKTEVETDKAALFCHLSPAATRNKAPFEEKGYPKTDDEWQQIWANDTSAVLAHLLGSNSTKIGCVIGKCVEVTTQPPSDDQERREGSGGGEGNKTEVETDKAALFCQLSPAATKDKAPFDEDYFNGLIARTTALADMTKEDLKSAAGGGAATVALPTVLIAGLVAILTRTTALADMTKEDLKSAAGGGAATVALPTVLIAGLVAILTAISA